jgi:uracil-DNA glycosylase family 4
MGFFFSEAGKKKRELKTPGKRKGGNGEAKPKKQTKLQDLMQQAKLGCAGCPLDTAKLESPKMPPTGATRPLYYMLGEAPGETEDEEGEQFVGKSGKFLRKQVPKELEKKIRWNNVIRCRPPQNRDPEKIEIECCRILQKTDIEKTKPLIVIGVGAVPLQWMTGREKITDWRGRKIPMRLGSHSFWFCPILHPSFVVRQLNAKDHESQKMSKEWERTFQQDLARIFSYGQGQETVEAPEVEDPQTYYDNIILLQDYRVSDIEDAFNKLIKLPKFALDLETTGFRPYPTGSRILSLAAGTYEKTYAVPVRHSQSKWTEKQLVKLDELIVKLIKKSKGKWCQNTKFEQEWLGQMYGEDILFDTEWHDTMAQAYVLDERGGKSLGDLTLQYFGFDVKALSKVNVEKLDEEILENVLLYNGLDAKYTDLLSDVQGQKVSRESLDRVYDIMNRRCRSFAVMQLRGVAVDRHYAVEQGSRFTSAILEVEKKIAKLPDVKSFVAKHGAFKPTSNKDLPIMFRDHLKIIHPGKSKTGEGARNFSGTDKQKRLEAKAVGKEATKYSLDEEVLQQIDHPLAGLLLEMRGLKKIHGTYVKPYLPNDPTDPTVGKHVDPRGYVHSQFNHIFTRTGRSSSEDPNMQNWPKLEWHEVKSIVAAFRGYVLVSGDYGQIEARVIAMMSKDIYLVNALWEGYDIHMEWAEKIAHAYPAIVGGKMGIKNKEEMKVLRQNTKNMWVFPLFFGNSYEACAVDLKIPTHKLAPLYDEFWETFTGVHDWQEDVVKAYKKNGYVEAITGRRRHAPMSRNEIINTPVQGSASDIVVDTQVALTDYAHEKGVPHFQPVLNVHDDLTSYYPKKTLEENIEVLGRMMVEVRYNFINVPLTAEISVGPSWGAMEEVAVFKSTDFGHKRK